jgi:hypothetical protein
VAAWHRGERPALSRFPLPAWEPVIYHGGRPTDPSRVDALQARRVDSLVHGIAPMTTLPGRVIGAKPAAFCRWMFQLLGALPGDSLDDLYPGSGAVGRAWATYTQASVARQGDTSAPAIPDASPRAGHDASHQARTDASPAAASDASCPSAHATPHPDRSHQALPDTLPAAWMELAA